MAKLIIHQEKVADNQELVKICPFGAMEEKDGKLTINICSNTNLGDFLIADGDTN